MDEEIEKMAKIASRVANKGELQYNQESMDEAFPDVDPGFVPLGSRLIVQIRTPATQSRGGIILTEEVKETEWWNTQIGKVRALGALAFKNRETMEAWPEGSWAKVSDYVRIPKYNQDKWWVEYDTKVQSADGNFIKGKALFMLINDLDILAIKVGNPLAVKAYV